MHASRGDWGQKNLTDFRKTVETGMDPRLKPMCRLMRGKHKCLVLLLTLQAQGDGSSLLGV